MRSDTSPNGPEPTDAEATPRAGEEKYRHLFENLNDAAFLADANTGRLLDANRQAEVLLGRPRDEIIGLHQTELHPPGTADQYRQKFADHVAKGHAADYDGEVIRKDGAIVPVSISAAAFALGGRDLVIGLFHDTTERKRGEEALRQVEEQYRTLVNNVPIGVFRSTPDPGGKLIAANPALARISGRESPDEIIGLPAADFYGDPANRAALSDSILAQGNVSGIELYLEKKDGTPVWVNISAHATRAPDGSIQYFDGTVEDITGRKRTEEALRESEERLGLAIAGSNAGLWDLEIRWGEPGESPVRQAYFSPRLKGFIGYKDDEFPNSLEAWDERVLPEDLPRLKASARDHFEGRKPLHEVEYRIRHKDGSIRWIHSRGKIQKDNDGAPIRWTGVDWDVTERKKTEEALHESEEKYRLILENTGTAMSIVEQDGTLSFANKSYEALSGYSEEELNGMSIFNVIAPKDMERLKQYDDARMSGAEAPTSFEFDFVAKSGEPKHVLATVHFIPGTKKRVGSLIDITERKRAEEALQRRLKVEQVVASISARFVGLAPTEVTTGIDFALRALGQCAGVDRSYVFLLSDDGATMSNTHEWCAEGIERQIASLQNMPTDLVPWWIGKLQRFETIHIPRVADLPAEASAEKEIIQAQDIQSLVVVPLIARGRLAGFLGFDSVRTEKTWAQEDIALLKVAGGIIVSALETSRAEQERRKLEAQIQEAQKLESLGVLAGGIAHDFNNLLAGIIGNTDLALAGLSPGSSAQEPIEEAKKAGLRASELTKQLLAYTGKGPLEIRAINLNELVKEMGHLLKVSISKKVSLACHLAAEPLAVMGDASQIQQVIMNLITNASEAIGDAIGVITLRTGIASADEAPRVETLEEYDLPACEYVFLEVADTGSGMDEETRARIFDPFFTKKFTGRGLGLAAVQGIVRAHGGTIEVTTAPGEGTTFRVLLPRAAQLAEAPAPELTAPEAWRGSGTILVVDDELFVRDVMAKILTHAGFTVLTAAEGRSGLEVFREHADEIIAVLLDMTMPKMSGQEVFRELRQINPNVPVILTSGYGEPDATGGFDGEALAGFIHKPFELDTFIAKVRHALEK